MEEMSFQTFTALWPNQNEYIAHFHIDRREVQK
jgi:hypothetical protein